METRDWRNVLETDEEWLKRIDEEYIVDPETNDVVGRRLTPYEQALIEGCDWFEKAEKEPYDDFFLEDPSESIE